MNGHIRPRSPGSWEIRWRADSRTFTKTIKGTKRDAREALRAALVAVDRGEHIEPSKLAVGEHVRNRIALWHTSGTISTRTAEVYGYLAAGIATALGPIRLQKLTTTDIEAWHASMRDRGLSVRTMQKCHAVLAKALADGVRHKVLTRNVARDQGRPGGERTEAVICPKAEQVKALLTA